MNVTVISGRVLKEPVFKINETEKGVFHVATFIVAVKKMHSGGFSFLRANVFGKLADSVKENLHKGMNVTLSGEIVTSSYDDRETGKKVYTTDIKANWLEFDQDEANHPEPMPEDAQFMHITEEDMAEMPFK